MRFTQDSPEEQFARARNEALDNAYYYALSNARSRKKRLGSEELFQDEDTYSESEKSSLTEFVGLLFICPFAIYVIQLWAPSILSELAPGGLRGTVWLLDIFVLLLSYAFPLLLRFVFLKRPIENLWTALALFPVNLLFADFFTSLLLHFSFVLPSRNFLYVPAFYLMGLGPLFLLSYAHCSILRLSFRAASRKSFRFFPRLLAHTATLTISVALGMVLCISANNTGAPSAAARTKPSSIEKLSILEEPWQTLELWDAGVMEIPGSWYVEDSNGKQQQIRNGDAVQHIREALLVRPYGQREEGLDFAFELHVHWWTRANGRMLSPPQAALEKGQQYQYESFQNLFGDVVTYEKTRSEHQELKISTLTVETHSIPGHSVRFKNIAFEHGEKLFFLTVGYPSHEEEIWEIALDRILWRWRLDLERQSQ